MSLNFKNNKLQRLRFKDYFQMDQDHIEEAYQALSLRMKRADQYILQPKKNWWKITGIAATLALLVVSGIFFTVSYDRVIPAEIHYVTNNFSQITLPDSTRVWLSANSTLKYRQEFTGRFRDVELIGEAYFEVQKDAKHPFRVQAGNQMVEVLGTSFNIRAYENESEQITSLTEGSVEISGFQENAVMLQPGQQLVYHKSDDSFIVEPFDEQFLMSWKKGIYVFNNMPFVEIVGILEKGFGVHIKILNEELKQKPYTAKFENGETLEEIIELIRINAKYTYRYNNGTLIIE